MKEQREKNGRSETLKREVTMMIETQGGNIVIGDRLGTECINRWQ